MSSKPGEPNALAGPGLPAGTGSEAAEFQEKQAAAEQAKTPPTTESTEKKEESVTEGIEKLKIEEPTASSVEKNEQPVTTEETKVEDATAAVAAAPVPAAESNATPPTYSDREWPETGPDHPLTKFFDAIEDLTKDADYNEVYGITLSKSAPFQTKLILQKFLRANSNDLAKAKDQLLDTLKWRKEFNPLKAAEGSYEKDRFDGLGYIMEIDDVPESPNKRDIVTFNIYGAVKDNKKTFGDLDGFLKWRVGIMERSVQKLGLATATEPIPDFGDGPDPYQGFQVHDYLQVSFIRMDPDAKAASKKTIETFGRYYPETLSRKFFVNVPVVMGWLFSAMKLFVAKETIRKFTVLSYGDQLAAELGQGIPKEYGGSAGELKEVGEGMKLEG